MTFRDVEILFINAESTIKEAMEVIDKGAKGIALIVDKEKRLQGILTDPDIRRAILRGASLDDLVKKIMNEQYTFLTKNYTQTLVKSVFEHKKIKQIPVLDDSMRVVELILYHEIYSKPAKENWAIIMAGGLGTRLRPLTNEVPKPMLHVGAKPILQTIIEQLKSYGFINIILSLNYKGDMIEDYFQDGSNFGVNIKYIKESKRLGTAGAIYIAKQFLDKSFFVINGDILTRLNFEEFIKYHMKNKNCITIGTRKHKVHVPYGVVSLRDEKIVSLKEKPSLDLFVNAGIYCLEPRVIQSIPEDDYFDITELINIYLNNNSNVGSFPITEYWMDIGQIDDYRRANEDYYEIFLDEVGIK